MVVTDISAETVDFMLKHERSAFLHMIQNSWLPARVMRLVFEATRVEAGLHKTVARLSASHPDSEVRALAAVELLAFVPVTDLGKYLWC
jgi:hypothetical protein